MIFFQSPPHLALQKFIGQYLYFSFNTSALPCLEQTLLPYDIPAISFFIGSVFLDTSVNATGPKPNPFPSYASYFAGLRTLPFTLHFKENEDIKVFAIAFKPSGVSALFRREMSELTNHVPDLSILSGTSESAIFVEQLSEAKDFAEQIKICDHFFLKRVSTRYDNCEQLNAACYKLMRTNGLTDIKKLSYHTDLSLRSLERQFTERVGVTPKMFARFKRFHNALSLMNHKMPPSWADIAYSCGYYDQAHFIKEFKTFSLHSPSVYSPLRYVLYNQIILFRNFSSF